MDFTRLSDQDYQAFVAAQERCFYTQLPEYGDVREAEGFAVERVGLVRGGEVRGVATIVYQPWKKLFRRAVVPYGPVLDWSDKQLVQDFFEHLRGWVERDRKVLTLRVNPQIGENDSVRMQIYQEVSSVDPASVNSPSGLTTNKRSIESNVVVGDSQIIVLGGLLSDEYANSQQKIPLLGDIPVIGSLFRSENRSRKKTNLMVFLRPIVVRDLNDSHALSMDRYDMMRATQINTQPNPGLIQPLQAPVLPAIRPQDDSAWAPVNDAPEKVLPRPLIYENMQLPGAHLQPAYGNSENIIITPNGNIPSEIRPVPAHISTDTWDNSGGA